MKIPKIHDLKGPQCSEKYFKYHYPEFLQYLQDNYSKDLSFQEKLYWYYNKISTQPSCKTCGNPTKFINSKEGYREYCCRKCMNCNTDKREKTKQTCIERYGGVAPAKCKYVVNKSKKTNLERYGVENAMQNKNISKKSQQTNIDRHGGIGNASQNIKEKYKQTCIERYGVENAMQTDIVKETLKRTMLERYGVEHQSQLKSIRMKIQQSRRKIEMEKHPFIIGYTSEGDWVCKCPHEDCNKCKEKTFVIAPLIYSGRQNDKIEICTNLLPVGKDNTKNTTIEIFVANILDKYNIEYKSNYRKIINPKELDIYIPDKNIAIECNGIRWHNDKYKSNTYHINKYKQCKEKGIQLLTIWEDWIITKPDIIESIITNKLGLNNNNIIYARKCEIKEVNPSICSDFLHNNHIQGRSASTVRLGLYYNNELVSLMTFSPPRVNMGSKNHKQQWELVRFCNKLNTRVIGGASKLLSHFIKSYNPTSIVSFSMNDISDGNLYKKLGFESNGIISSSYWYIEPKTYKRYHRMIFTKQSIVKRGWRDKVDDTWTEKEVMFEKGYYRIYDSGQKKWVLNLE